MFVLSIATSVLYVVPPSGSPPSSLVMSTFSLATAILFEMSATSQLSNESMLWNFILRVMIACFLMSTPGIAISLNVSCSSSFADASATAAASPSAIAVLTGIANPSASCVISASSSIGASAFTRSTILSSVTCGTTAPVFAVVNVNALCSTSVRSPSSMFPRLSTAIFLSHADLYSGDPLLKSLITFVGIAVPLSVTDALLWPVSIALAAAFLSSMSVSSWSLSCRSPSSSV